MNHMLGISIIPGIRLTFTPLAFRDPLEALYSPSPGGNMRQDPLVMSILFWANTVSILVYVSSYWCRTMSAILLLGSYIGSDPGSCTQIYTSLHDEAI